MMDNKQLQNIPLQRIKPVDGMAVTAMIWEQSHEYHRQQLKAHQVLQHNNGLLTGLDVIASVPPDSCVNIMAGAALDSNGDLIVLPEPVAFDFGNAQGPLYLVLSYTESRPEQSQNGGPLLIHSQYSVEVSATPPQAPALELARIRRSQGDPILDAARADRPGANEIDMRFRVRGAGQGSASTVSVAVCHLGAAQAGEAAHGAGWLAKALERLGSRVCVDVGLPVDARLEPYTLIYLVAHGPFQLSREEMNALYGVIRSGSTVLMEACHGDTPASAAALEGSFNDLAGSFGIRLVEAQPGQPLLTEPNLFGSVPPGFETEGTPRLLVGDGLIVSLNDYGCLWQGLRRGRPAAREEIRTAQEWGQNLIQFALARKQETSAR